MVLNKNIQKNARQKRRVNRPKTFREYKSKDVTSRGYITIIIIIGLILLDRITKIGSMISGNKDYGIVAITNITNNGAAFGMFQFGSISSIILAIISVIVIIVIIYYRKHIPKSSFILLVSGIIGNLIDRITFGRVIDFIDFKFWPIFNVADSLICIGVAIWIIVLFKSMKKDNTKDTKDIK